MIRADGESALDRQWAQQRDVGGLLRIVDMVSGTQIDQYNFETLQLAQHVIATVVDAIRETRCAEAPVIDDHPCDDVEGVLIHLTLGEIPNETVRRHLETIPTGLTIDERSLEMLIRYGRELVLTSPDLQRLRESLKPDGAEP